MSVSRKFVTRSVALLAVAAFTLVVSADPSDAARKRKSTRSAKPAAAASSSSSEIAGSGRYAAFVIDANTGKVLFDRNGSASRHPASLTKMMTLFVLFEDLDKGRVRLDTPFPVSAKAAAQAPSKLGLRPGETITAEDAIKSLVTLSANDAAMVIAEALGGSQDAFADRMNRTARSLGMTGTTFYNPNGLPDMRQITTARDMVVLGEALQERFPSYYRYFQTRSFAYKGRVIGNHNRLLGSVSGVDGIKTGYTQASGFNLVSSIRRDGRHVVAAVMGGPTGAARDRHMEKLLETYTPQASSAGKSVSIVAWARKGGGSDGDDAAPRVATTTAPVRVVAEEAPAPTAKASVERGAAVAMARAILLPDTNGQQTAAQPAPMATAMIAAPVRAGAASMPSAQAPKPVVVAMAQQPNLPPKAAERLPGADEPRVKSLADATISSKDVADHIETATIKPRLAPAQDDRKQVASVKVSSAPAVTSSSAASGAWIIQIAATDSEASARTVIGKAQSQVKTALNGRSGFTESNGKGMYRARFGGFDNRSEADAACAALKKKDFSCLAIKN